MAWLFKQMKKYTHELVELLISVYCGYTAEVKHELLPKTLGMYCYVPYIVGVGTATTQTVTFCMSCVCAHPYRGKSNKTQTVIVSSECVYT